MSQLHNTFNTLRDLACPDGTRGKFYSLPALQEAGALR